MDSDETEEHTLAEIRILEGRLRDAKARLRAAASGTTPPDQGNDGLSIASQVPVHSLMLLADSALPLGSFAYSSGLESYMAHHHKPLPRSLTSTTAASFHRFLELSISSISATTLPYLLAAHRDPDDLQTLDNDLDASTPCTVARRASVAQGLALLGVWDRAFRASNASNSLTGARVLEDFSDALRNETTLVYPVNGHFAPMWGVVARSMGLDAQQSAYIYLVNHVKAVLSAAVRASVMGPYQAQAILAGQKVQSLVADQVASSWHIKPEDAGQVVPALDLWIGRHELLYTRIFNS